MLLLCLRLAGRICDVPLGIPAGPQSRGRDVLYHITAGVRHGEDLHVSAAPFTCSALEQWQFFDLFSS